MEFIATTSLILLNGLEKWKHISGRPTRDIPAIVILGGSTVMKADIGTGRAT